MIDSWLMSIIWLRDRKTKQNLRDEEDAATVGQTSTLVRRCDGIPTHDSEQQSKGGTHDHQ